MTLLFLTGCGQAPLEAYKNETPKFVLEEFFSGKLTSHGMFQDRFGKVRQRFTADLSGTWNAGSQTLGLTEDFTYADGDKKQINWRIVKTGDNIYEGTAENVIGKAIGKSAGNAFSYKYTYDLQIDNDIWRVKFNDMFYMLDENTVMNKTAITRWGIKLGDLYILFRKDSSNE